VSRPVRMPSGGPTAGRSTRRDARHRRYGMMRGGSAGTVSAATRCRRTAPVMASLVVSALAPLVPAHDAHAQSRIGRLFSSPEQRVELDRLRDDTGSEEAPEPAPVPGPAGRVSHPEPEHGATAFAVTLDGVVMRSDGHRVAWVNGVETAAGESTPAGVRVETDAVPGGGLRIRVSREGTSVILAPGQSVDRSGRVRDVYERQASEGMSGARKSRDEQPTAARMTGRGSAGL